MKKVQDGRTMITMTEAAHRLGQSWERTWRMTLRGELNGEKRDGRWMVSASDVDGFVMQKNHDVTGIRKGASGG